MPTSVECYYSFFYPCAMLHQLFTLSLLLVSIRGSNKDENYFNSTFLTLALPPWTHISKMVATILLHRSSKHGLWAAHQCGPTSLPSPLQRHIDTNTHPRQQPQPLIPSHYHYTDTTLPTGTTSSATSHTDHYHFLALSNRLHGPENTTWRDTSARHLSLAIDAGLDYKTKASELYRKANWRGSLHISAVDRHSNPQS